MPSIVGIMNKALRLIGQTEIASPEQQTPSAVRCSAAWRDVVDEVLRAHPWAHATVWAALSKSDTPPPFGFAHAYVLPADCVRVIDVRADGNLARQGLPFEVVRGNIYTDAAPCNTRYVARDADPTFWPPDFCDAVAAKLAAEVALPLARDGGAMMRAMLDRYQWVVDAARLNDAATSREVELDEGAECCFIKARG